MKSFIQPKSGILRNNPSAETSSPNPSPFKQRSSRRQKENAPPPDQNALPDSASSPSLATAKSAGATGKSRSPLPPRPPTSNSNPLKRKLNMETVFENGVPGTSDSGVKVIVRMRPPNKDEEEGELILQKVSSDSLSILGQTFTFDSVADSGATQQDIFQLVGAPLVENCLAGFNSSIFAYGQTGSGKTYTMCGPANALLEENSSSNQLGLTPRVFEKLFARINEEQIKHAEKQLKYQCRCSFLEIYNEQITDLLDPNQKNLQVREDVKTGVYVENLTEEYVCTMKDVKQLLIKGLSNRKTGATSLNVESSRSHSVFTCIVESRCKSMADGLSSFRTSRINLVDLAGSERQKLTGTAGERLKEAGNINRSLSQLGNLINILAEVSQTGKQRHIPYRDSRLTFLLQESLGGNAKLAMICAISLAQSCKSETLSTLRFAQRAKAIKNKAVVNEVMQDDVNVLREVIRQLRDELLLMKANGNSTNTNGGYSTGWNARRSLNLLKFSLNRPMTLPHIEDDSDEEMEIDEEAVERLCIQVGLQSADFEKNNINDQRNLKTCQSDSKVEACKESILGEEKQIDPPEIGCGSDQGYEETDVHMQDCQLEEMVSEEFKNNELADGCSEPVVRAPISPKLDGLDHQSHAENNNTEGSSGQPIQAIQENLFVYSDHKLSEVSSGKVDEAKSSADISIGGGSADILIADPSHNSPKGSPNTVLPLNISIVPCKNSPVHQSPTLSVSPRVSNSSRKGLKTTSMLSASQKDLIENNNLGPEVLQFSLPRPSTKTSKNSLSPTEYLAASLHRGLQVIDSHIQSSALRRSSFRFSCKPVDVKPLLPVDKVDVGVQTLFQDPETLQVDSSAFICSKCTSRASQVKSKEANDCSGLELVPVKEANDCSGLELVPVDGSDSAENSRIQVPKAVEKVLAGAIRREMAIEEFSAKQAAEIMQLNRLVQQYKHEREGNAIIEQMREDKIIRLESLMDSILPSEEYMEQELVSLMHEHKLLKEKYDNHPEVLRTKIELKRVQDELDSCRNFFDMGERDVLLEEIQHLRSQLQYYIHSSPMPARKQSPLLQLTYSCEPTSATLCVIPESNEENANERSEQEKHLSSCILESTEESAEEKFEQERRCWTEAESKWIILSEELRIELEASRSISEKQKQELDAEKRCCEELKEALQMAMQGHAHILEQYAELEERHIALLARHRRIQEGVGDVKKAAAKAGVKGAESRFINSLAAEISTLKVEKEREMCYLRDENKGLQAQLRDTAEAVQAAGELLVRLKEAEEAVAISQKRALEAEHNAEKAYKQIDKLKKKQKTENTSMNQLLAESPLPKEVLRPVNDDSNLERYDGEMSLTGADDQQWREEFVPFHHGEDGGELSKLAEPSWFSGYDRCNV
ncbi:kinesin-like protein KIN-12B [Macadamia integrifolia]|uniref:kinesin-like protein KIN-12B n=1 Tax=Macadamia integrifolia TaxID=60698 RepID=UPI001C528DD1|nr:kinesin-like protein KIN-12B [Macadamia integrifolia]